MQHKFACLIQLTTIWESLPCHEFVNIITHLLEIDVVGVYKKGIISGIFQQLYDEGDSNDDIFFADLLVFSQNLQIQSQLNVNNINNKPNKNKFSQLSDGLLCDIASYLPSKDVFCKWNLVNRKFVQIGLNPASINCFTFNRQDSKRVNEYLPNFKLDVTLSKLKSLVLYTSPSMKKIVDQISIKHLESLTFCMSLIYALNFPVYCLSN